MGTSATCSAVCSGAAGGARPTRRGPQRGADVETELHLSFEDAVHGVTTSVNLDHRRALPYLRRDRVPPPAPSRRPARAAGAPAPSRTTRACSPSARSARSALGAGTIVTTPCPTCRGPGVEHRNRSVKVRIPPGVEDGQRIRVKGRGAAGPGNGAAAATSTWWSGSTATVSSGAGAAT